MKREDGLDRYIEWREKKRPGFKGLVEAARARILCVHRWEWLYCHGMVYKCQKCGKVRR